jgi:endo-1,4-beta-mannosidase
MWTRYDGSVVREELAVLAEHGCNITRSFCFWPDFMPEPGRLDEDVLARFGDFLNAHVERELQTIPTFIVGHMSGENWDPTWRDGRDLYRDEWFVSQQSWFAAEVAGRFHEHPAIAAWLISNEIPLYGGTAPTEVIARWAETLVAAVRSTGAQQPISLGDGAWGIETSGRDNGYSLRALAPLVDFVGPHVYPMQDDEVRQLLTAAFVCELAGDFEKPVVLEEFGTNSDFSSDENSASYYRQVLYSTLLAGARGWIAWNNCDYDDLADEDPYRHHPFEMHFGLTDRDGRPKQQLREIAAFSRDVGRLAAEGWEAIKGDVAIVVPEHFERELPFTAPAYREDIRDSLFQSYIAAREADLPVAFQRERDGLAGGARLYLAPCAKLLSAPGASRLRAFVESGATLYASYFAGSTPNQRGPWFAGLEEIFGVRHRLRYGLVDPILDEEAIFQFVEDFGDIPSGTRLSFPVSGEHSARAFLPVEPAGAEIVAIDGHGRPALLRCRLGSGSAVLCTYPLEHMAARRPWANPESTWRIYSALAVVADVERPVRVDDPRVLVGHLRSGGSETTLFINASSDRVEATPIVARGTSLAHANEQLMLEPFGVAMVTHDTVSEGTTLDEVPSMIGREEGRDAPA